MDRHCSINLLEYIPVVRAAIHDGHHLSEEISQLIEMEDDEQLREEDPYTSIWAFVSRNHIICNTSRFEFDLNPSPEKAIFREEQIRHYGKEIFEGYDDLGTILFVNSHNQKEIE